MTDSGERLRKALDGMTSVPLSSMYLRANCSSSSRCGAASNNEHTLSLVRPSVKKVCKQE